MTEEKKGVIFGLLAFFLWGFLPLYFSAINYFSPLELTAYRIIFSFLTLFLFLLSQRKFISTFKSFVFHGHISKLLTSTLFIATNWFLFVYAIEQKQVLQTSFGYFISPIVSIFLGIFILNEKITWIKSIALLLSLFAVGLQAFSFQGFPWISIVIGVTFSLYGLMRKYIHLGSIESVTFETFILFFPSLILLFRLESSNARHYLQARNLDYILIFLSGLVTVLPMLFFSASVRRLQITTIGFLQYISPSLQFIIATLILNESLDFQRGISFSIIWLACLIVACNSYIKRETNFIEDRFA